MSYDYPHSADRREEIRFGGANDLAAIEPPYAEDIDGIWHERRDDFWDNDIFADVRAHAKCGADIWSCHVSQYEPDEPKCTACFCPELLSGLWAEDGEWVWLPADQYENHGKAKYAAFTGRGLPVGFNEAGDIELIDMTCRFVYARPGEEHEHGWAGRGDATWHPCGPDHPKAKKFYEVSVK